MDAAIATVSGSQVSARQLTGSVASVSLSPRHSFSKPQAPQITLLEGLGVEGDAHAGTTTQHRYLLGKDPARENLTQVHLIQSELFPELARRGFDVSAGQLGENVTTAGVDLLTLPVGTMLYLGADAAVRVTGLRSPCSLINRFRPGLMKALIEKSADGAVLRKSGIMGVVVTGGVVAPGDELRMVLPSGEHIAMGVV